MKIFIWSLVTIAVAVGLLWGLKQESVQTGVVTIDSHLYDTFAQCIKDSGAKFYGASWCPHCHDQNTEFGESAKLLPYIECATADNQGQTQICKDKGITGYPTWIFKDGSQLSGKLEMDVLAEKTSCSLPAGVATSTNGIQ